MEMVGTGGGFASPSERSGVEQQELLAGDSNGDLPASSPEVSTEVVRNGTPNWVKRIRCLATITFTVVVFVAATRPVVQFIRGAPCYSCLGHFVVLKSAYSGSTWFDDTLEGLPRVEQVSQVIGSDKNPLFHDLSFTEKEKLVVETVHASCDENTDFKGLSLNPSHFQGIDWLAFGSTNPHVGVVSWQRTNVVAAAASKLMYAEDSIHNTKDKQQADNAKHEHINPTVDEFEHAIVKEACDTGQCCFPSSSNHTILAMSHIYFPQSEGRGRLAFAGTRDWQGGDHNDI